MLAADGLPVLPVAPLEVVALAPLPVAAAPLPAVAAAVVLAAAGVDDAGAVVEALGAGAPLGVRPIWLKAWKIASMNALRPFAPLAAP